jgi:hypothetical protein
MGERLKTMTGVLEIRQRTSKKHKGTNKEAHMATVKQQRGRQEGWLIGK